MTTPFITAMPSRAMKPTEAGTDRYSPVSHSAVMPPVSANGKLLSTSTLWRTERKVDADRTSLVKGARIR